MAAWLKVHSFSTLHGEPKMDISKPYREHRIARSWLHADIEVIELRQLLAVTRDLASRRLSLRAALDERGGQVEARLRPRVPTPGAYHGPGHLSLVTAGEQVWSWTDRIEEFRCVVVHFSDELIGQVLESGAGLARPVAPRLMFENTMIWNMARALALECIQPQPGGRLYGESLTAAMAVEVLRARCGDAPGRGGGIAPFRLRRVLDYIDATLDQDISMQALADEAMLSVPHFMRAFRQSTGQTPFRYVQSQRVERARRLVASSRMPIADIAACCGFADQAHMNKCFRRLVGDTPGRLRRAYL